MSKLTAGLFSAFFSVSTFAGQAQQRADNTEGRFQLFRIGDAVSARNTHAAIYDALRLVKDL